MKTFTCFLLAFLALLPCSQTGLAAGRKLAVVVGVNAYQPNSGLPTLQHAGSDATKLSGGVQSQRVHRL